MSDLISRQAALKALEWHWAGKAAIDAIKNLPSAEPEKMLVAEVKLSKDQIQDAVNNAVEEIKAEMELKRRKGKWIHDNPNTFRCSKCNKYLDIGCGNMKMNYCPNCGADMREGEQE